MEKKKEGKPGEARAILRRSVRENGYASLFIFLLLPLYLTFWQSMR